MTYTEKKNDTTKVISMTQFDFQLELDKVRLEQKAIDDDHLREVKKMLIDKACEWLEENQAHIVSESGVWLYWTAFLKDFRKAMEKE